LRLAGREEVQLSVAADAEPDELRRIELRRHLAFLETQEPAVEGPPRVAAVVGIGTETCCSSSRITRSPSHVARPACQLAHKRA
jgi:hypothetical protein